MGESQEARRARRHRPYRGVTGRAASKQQGEARAAGRRLDLDYVRACARASPLWQEDCEFEVPFERSDLIYDLNRLARYYAQPFLLGDFDYQADIAPLSSMLADLDWVNGPQARPDGRSGAQAYPKPVLQLARSSDVQTNQPDELFDTVADGYLELFFDWILPLSCINGQLRDAAMAQIKPAYSAVTGDARALINGRLKKVGGREINAQVASHLRSREKAAALVDAWAGGSLLLDPDDDVLARFWFQLHKIAEGLDEAHYHEAAEQVRSEIDARWGPVAAPEKKLADRDRPEPRTSLVGDPGLLDFFRLRADREAPEPVGAEEEARHGQVDEALKQLDGRPPDLAEYERASLDLLAATPPALAGPGGGGGSRVPSGISGDATVGGEARPDPETSRLALSCLQRALETNFTSSKKETWRAFVKAQLEGLGATVSVDQVCRAAADIAGQALLNRSRPPHAD